MKKWNRALTLLLLVLGTAGAKAQTDDYNPANPPEPMMRYAVTVSCEPAEAGYTSGGGKYEEGKSVSVSTSAKSNYVFQYWMQDGVKIDKSKSFKYTMGNQNTSFIAVYAYNPTNPAEPTPLNTYRLFLETNEEGSCTFNLTSGDKQRGGQKVTVTARNFTPGYKFQGWYQGETLVSTKASFSYTMPTQNVTLTAHLVYDPTSPGDPTGSQADVDQNPVKPGDVNGDGEVNEVDAQLILDVSVGLKSLSDLRAPAAIDVPGGNSSALEVNAQIVLDYSVAAVKPW